MSQCHLVHHKSYMTGLELNPGLPGYRPVTNCLNYISNLPFFNMQAVTLNTYKTNIFGFQNYRILLNAFVTALNAVT